MIAVIAFVGLAVVVVFVLYAAHFGGNAQLEQAQREAEAARQAVAEAVRARAAEAGFEHTDALVDLVISRWSSYSWCDALIAKVLAREVSMAQVAMIELKGDRELYWRQRLWSDLVPRFLAGELAFEACEAIDAHHMAAEAADDPRMENYKIWERLLPLLASKDLDLATCFEVADGVPKKGMSEQMLRVMWGDPGSVTERELKTKSKKALTWYIDGRRLVSRTAEFEDGRLVAWTIKDD